MEKRHFDVRVNTSLEGSNYFILGENGEPTVDWAYEYSSAFIPKLYDALKNNTEIDLQELFFSWQNLRAEQNITGFFEALFLAVSKSGYEVPEELSQALENPDPDDTLNLMEEIIIEFDDLIGYDDDYCDDNSVEGEIRHNNSWLLPS